MHSMYGGLRAEGGAPVSGYIKAEDLVSDGLTANKITSSVINEDTSKKATEKPTKASLNPKQGVGSQKLPLHLVSPLATAYMAVGLANGAGKYGVANYKGTEVLLSIYLAATLRHLFAFMEGQEFDPDDGSPHLGAVMANMAIILDARAVGTLVDDRAIAGGYIEELKKLTAIYQNLLELHKDRKPFDYTRNNMNEERS